MKTFLLLIFLVTAAIAAPPAATPSKDWKDITPLITSSKWKYHHPSFRNIELRFYANRSAVSVRWKGVWDQTGPYTIEITDPAKNKAVLTFNEKFTGYTSVHFDGEKIEGFRVGEVPSSLK